ncbi:type II secretion system protein GspJ [Acinetobacter puyangensis]|uniref:Type II secretion system protein J n=1 Tax=Acinetobacter puyangensis TaxID=1096779 RepID=A0A240E9W4_9GAMM|nr:type II secretion system protein GspJ [Acinetobacter puyangensis]SNX45517.1 type II secretion system protein J (GspJ) [Acinetobacter puyangensis]
MRLDNVPVSHLEHSSRSSCEATRLRAKRYFINPHSGFTLIEVLVAIAIFAVLSATGWIVFDQLIKNRDRNAEHAQSLTQLQFAYAQMLRDLSQAVPIAGQQNGQLQPALALGSQQLKFNKAGVIDPLQQGLDAFESIEYGFDAGRQALVRYKKPYIYQKQGQETPGDVVLAPIENLQFQALDPAVQSQWPIQSVTDSDAQNYILSQLPKGIEVKFSYQAREYRWVFSLVTALPDLEQTQNTQDGENDKTS